MPSPEECCPILDGFEKNCCAAVTLSVTARPVGLVFIAEMLGQPSTFRRNRKAQGDSLRDGADGTVGFKWTCADPLFRVGNESVIIDPLFCSSQGVRVGFTLSPENCIELILV